MSSENPAVFTPAQLEGVYGVAYRFLESGDLRHAVHAFRVMVRFAPTDERGWLGLGSCHEGLDDDDVASEIFGAGAVVSRPPSARCLIALSRLKLKEGDRRAAIALLDEASELADETAPELVDAITDERGALS